MVLQLACRRHRCSVAIKSHLLMREREVETHCCLSSNLRAHPMWRDFSLGGHQSVEPRMSPCQAWEISCWSKCDQGRNPKKRTPQHMRMAS